MVSVKSVLIEKFSKIALKANRVYREFKIEQSNCNIKIIIFIEVVIDSLFC